jgi:hypothetical protein
MRRYSLILLIGAALVLSTFTQIKSVHALSCGYERQVSDHYEVYLEYLPTFPVDAANPSASEEWAFKFYIKQKNVAIPLLSRVLVPEGWTVDVYFRDDDYGNYDWTTWKRWYPLSMSDNNLPVSWSLSASCGPITLGTTIRLPDSNSFEPDYTKVPTQVSDDGGKAYMRVGKLKVHYYSNILWNGAMCEGAGSLGIPNDLAAQHLGDHIRMYFSFTMRWWSPCGLTGEERAWFIAGDDTPAQTDCFIIVSQGTTSFSTGGCPSNPPNYGSKIHTWKGGSRTCMPL